MARGKHCRAEFGCDCTDELEEVRTIWDLHELFERHGLRRLALHLSLARNGRGEYLFGPYDPIAGPYSGDRHA